MKVSQLDEAALKVEFRQTYKDVGLLGAWQIVYEMMFATNVMLEVIKEESETK
jgi:hypothetical protein